MVASSRFDPRRRAMRHSPRTLEDESYPGIRRVGELHAIFGDAGLLGDDAVNERRCVAHGPCDVVVDIDVLDVG